MGSTPNPTGLRWANENARCSPSATSVRKSTQADSIRTSDTGAATLHQPRRLHFRSFFLHLGPMFFARPWRSSATLIRRAPTTEQRRLTATRWTRLCTNLDQRFYALEASTEADTRLAEVINANLG
jgi:hypothetical protein